MSFFRPKAMGWLGEAMASLVVGEISIYPYEWFMTSLGYRWMSTLCLTTMRNFLMKKTLIFIPCGLPPVV